VPPWLKLDLDRVIAAAKLPVSDVLESAPAALGAGQARERPKEFRLHGRPQLEQFFRDHVIDIIENAERYRKLGIDFPSAVMLHGPPGCGKTFAVQRLVEYLGWPEFSIDASSIASPYIHDTSRKIAVLFDQAIQQKPSIIVMDEADAFIQNRSGEISNQYRVEEVTEFLRRVPEALANQVLVVAMTNRIELIDPAILRRGRFDHVIEVPMASAVEVRYLLDHLLAQRPCASDVDPKSYAIALAERPLSDVGFLIREAARLTARAGKDAIDHQTIRAALAEMNHNVRGKPQKQRIGFTATDVPRQDL
jgi:SpoVK/Ycf46/Vps4 family AAA+-type ATPase